MTSRLRHLHPSARTIGDWGLRTTLRRPLCAHYSDTGASPAQEDDTPGVIRKIRPSRKPTRTHKSGVYHIYDNGPAKTVPTQGTGEKSFAAEGRRIRVSRPSGTRSAGGPSTTFQGAGPQGQRQGVGNGSAGSDIDQDAVRRRVFQTYPQVEVPEGVTAKSVQGRGLVNASDPSLAPWAATATYDAHSLTIEDQGMTNSISLIQLRDACSCAKCIDPSTKQREFQTSDIPLNIGIEELKGEGDKLSKDNKLQIKWKNDVPGYDDTHTSTFSKTELFETLRRITYRWNRCGPVRIPWNQDIFARNQHWISYDDYANNPAAFKDAMRSLHRYGLIFVKDIPHDPESVERIATRMGPLRNSFYGSTWDVRSKVDAENVAYTNKFLGFHMDLLYMADPPGYQLLHCMTNSLAGGESLFSDTLRAVYAFIDKHPTLYNILARYPVRFGYKNNNQSYEYVRPIIERPFPNHQPNLFTHVNYSPPFQHPMLRYKEVGSFSREEVLRLWVQGMKELAKELEDPEHMFELKLQPGQCVIFENRRVVHARRGFDLSGGSTGSAEDGENKSDRWLRGAYVDEDALLSKFDTLRDENWQAWDATERKDGVWMGEMEVNATPDDLARWREEADLLEDTGGTVRMDQLI